MRRRTIVMLLSAAISSFGIFGFASPASASCTDPIDEVGCIENVVCPPLSKLADCVH